MGFFKKTRDMHILFLVSQIAHATIVKHDKPT
jgi:hypothetical protein